MPYIHGMPMLSLMFFATASQSPRENPPPAYHAAAQSQSLRLTAAELSSRVRVGDLVFIQSKPFPFRQVSLVTGCWSNHVGIIVEEEEGNAVVAESTFPFARRTSLSSFVKRSGEGRVAVSRLKAPLGVAEQRALRRAVQQRLGVLYDTGFNLESPRQFCSRFVREVLAEATGVEVGEIETFAQLLARQNGIGLGFWRAWYWGRIPWERRTVTPAAVLQSPHLVTQFDGFVEVQRGAGTSAHPARDGRAVAPSRQSTSAALDGGEGES